MSEEKKTPRSIQEYVPGKQVTLAHIIAKPKSDVYIKLGLDDENCDAIGILTITPSEAAIISADAGTKAGTNDPIVPVAANGTTSLYAYRVGLDGFHAVATNGGQIVRQWLPDFSTSGAVKRGEVEMGPVAVALKATKAATVLRGLKVKAGA